MSNAVWNIFKMADKQLMWGESATIFYCWFSSQPSVNMACTPKKTKVDLV